MASAMASKPISNIAVAFAAQSASASASTHIPIQREDSLPSGPDHRGLLLTPPNSISPTLPAHKHRPDIPTSAASPPPPSQVDSDIDLQDAVEHAAAQDHPASALSKEALAGLTAAGRITPTMLAKYHLPEIFEGHGALPIRDIMSQLATTVPGYARIDPPKARRLVVAALENRAGGGVHGEMKFEKVGWGRWTGYLKGQSPQGRGVPFQKHGPSQNGQTPPASIDSVGELQIPKNSRNRDAYSGSWAAGSHMSSRDEEMADKMSLDGSDASDSDASEMDLEHDLDDDTDEEDWAGIEPDSLRPGHRGHKTEYRDYNYLSRMSGARMRSASGQSNHNLRAGRSATPAGPPPNHHRTYNNISSSFSASRGNVGKFPASSTGVLGTVGQISQEQEAVQALLAMGSM